MKNLLFFIGCLISLSVFAQQSDTTIIFTSASGKEVKKDKAINLLKIYKRDSISWVKLTYDLNNTLLKKETFSESLLNILNGSFALYKKGKLALRGYYVNGSKTGSWVSFDSLSKATKISTYFQGKLNGPFTSYWENGKIREESIYFDCKRIGEWKLYFENGDLALNEIFDDNGKLTDSSYYDLDHKPTKKSTIIIPPQFPNGVNGFYRMLAKNIKYPSDALQLNVQGKAYITYIISEAGNVEDVRLVSAPIASIGTEAVRVIQTSPKWTPATFQNKPIAISQKIDLSFYLSNRTTPPPILNRRNF